MLGLGHLDLALLIYIIALPLGFILVARKIERRDWVGVAIDIAIFALVFKIHGGTVTGGLAATVAAPVVSWYVGHKRRPRRAQRTSVAPQAQPVRATGPAPVQLWRNTPRQRYFS